MEEQPKITFGFINTNRLYYLKSCIESILFCANDYPNKEFIVIDNASIEEGTEDYLNLLRDRGFKIFKRNKRDPSNEFAKGLNTICEEASGEFIVPLQGDMQFFLYGIGWLKEYINVFSENINNIGCITLDAQRNITNSSHKFSKPINNSSNYKFVYDLNRPPIAGAGDVMYSKKIIEKIYPWRAKENLSHEGGMDSETAMYAKIRKLSSHDNFIKNLRCAVPILPPACAIYNSQGTNARIRKNKRYGEYFHPKNNWKYYETRNYKEFKYITSSKPFGIESLAQPIGYNLLMDEKNNLMKIPIRPETATPDQYEELYPNPDEIKTNEKYLNEWLD